MGSTCRIVLGIVTCLLPGLCQTLPPIANYQQFFRQAAELKDISGPTTIAVRTNVGEQQMLITPPPEVTALSETELQALRAIAAECNARLSKWSEMYRTVVLEARLALVEQGDAAPGPRAILQRLDDEHDQIVLDQVKQLKSALTNEHFTALENLIRNAKSTSSFFPGQVLPKASGPQ